ncbi:(R)-2-haloacid dehalogenase [mine drainage metagenome]|uniref:(R)-2-haloacid dehalogenase n=1 Tax=mine drainage metagenome TaxID=410659 RepID=A0A1J5Q2B7_9ZZZZ
MEEHHADAPTRALYADVQLTLGLPFVNTDYRALARWPSYFDAAWRPLASRVRSDAYRQICAELHADVLARVAHALPNPAALRGAALREAAAADAPLDEVLAVARLFQWLLPGLVANVAFLRAQLA